MELFLLRGAEGFCRRIGRSLAANKDLSGLSALVSKERGKQKANKSPQRAHSQLMLRFPGVRRGNEYNPQPLRRVPRQTWTVTAARTTLSAFGVFGHQMWHPEPSLVIPGIASLGSAQADSGGPYVGWVLDTGKGDLTPHTFVATETPPSPPAGRLKEL